MSWFILVFALILVPIALDNWFHDPERFELRRAVYVSPWQRWIMDRRNVGRYASLGLLLGALACLSTSYVQSLPILTVLVWVLVVVSFLSFIAFQILPHTF